ncbi:MAG: flavin reductase family protein [Ignavibacteriaceae bacterium]|nr:flavin reductase family protein [Ignavibacteriaceae bacterium]
MPEFDPKTMPVPKVHQLLLGGVAPRPIALVSTLSASGEPNLSPFSFFNVFGANPPVVAFSPSRRGRDGSLKDTYHNLKETGECVIQAVTYPMTEQISLASTEYEPGVNEFIKSGLTPVKSKIVKPFGVLESPFRMECRLLELKSYGDGGASANIAVCEVLLFHVEDDLFVDGIIHPDRIDLVARMSGDFYCRASGDAVFKIAKPVGRTGIGFDNLPEFILGSDLLTASNLAQLANCEHLPADEDVKDFIRSTMEQELPGFSGSKEAFVRAQRRGDYKFMAVYALRLKRDDQYRGKAIEFTAAAALKRGDTDFAWKILLCREI